MERGSDHDKGGEHVALHISLGQSTRDRTVVHALDPRLKVVATIGYMASCLFVCDLPTALTATAALGLAAAAARTRSAIWMSWLWAESMACMVAAGPFFASVRAREFFERRA